MSDDFIHQWRQKELMKIPENRKLAIDRMSKKLDAIKEGLPIQKPKKLNRFDYMNFFNP